MTGRLLLTLGLVLLVAGCSAEPLAPASSPAQCHYVAQVLPDPACTPGVTDPRVTQDNIANTICARGYTARVRPPVVYTDHLKREQLVQYGQDPNQASAYEEDHLVALELGGSPMDPRNLWPEPAPSFHTKDLIENQLHAAVCSGQMPLAVAQQRIISDWRSAAATPVAR